MKPPLDDRHGNHWRVTRRALLLCSLLLFSAVAAAGCKHAATVIADVDPSGVYALVSIDGNEVPCDLMHGGASVPVESGIFTINADGTCGSKMTLTAPGGREVTINRAATYTRQGATLTMKWEGFGTTTGTIDGNVFNMNNEGNALSYRK